MQGFNMGRYVPPEYEGVVSGNKLHKKKAPGTHGSTQTVRFEMPFNVFCLHCDGHIAQGVRFNAEKKKVGNYYSSPIFAFRMKHTTCGKWIEIQTDPKNTTYLCTEGAKKQAVADGGSETDKLKVQGSGEIEDPFAKAEKNAEDKVFMSTAAKRVAELQALNDKQWEDPYENSRKMRKIFRDERNRLKNKERAAESIRSRNALHIELLDEAPEDSTIAASIEFGSGPDQLGEHALQKPLFDSSPGQYSANLPRGAKRGGNKTHLEALEKTLRINTRARIDPFLLPHRTDVNKSLSLPALQRKAATNSEIARDLDNAKSNSEKGDLPKDEGLGLVSYGTDSESE